MRGCEKEIDALTESASVTFTTDTCRYMFIFPINNVCYIRLKLFVARPNPLSSLSPPETSSRFLRCPKLDDSLSGEVERWLWTILSSE